jgi:type 1 glutamine amidotransferase
MKNLLVLLTSFILVFNLHAVQKPIRVLVVTGGHGYNKTTFIEMLSALGPEITFEIAELPKAYDMFLPENRDKYDVVMLYHMYQNITNEQKKSFSSCIAGGKPLVVLHHSICAYDDWEEYFRIAGGKYFHKATTFEGKDYSPSSYKHDLKFMVHVVNKKHPVTKGITDFEIFDETYDDFYVAPGVTPLLTTNEPSSTPVIGWVHQYGKARVATLQSGHDTPTFQLETYRKLLKQSIKWVLKGK